MVDLPLTTWLAAAMAFVAVASFMAGFAGYMVFGLL